MKTCFFTDNLCILNEIIDDILKNINIHYESAIVSSKINFMKFEDFLIDKNVEIVRRGIDTFGAIYSCLIKYGNSRHIIYLYQPHLLDAEKINRILKNSLIYSVYFDNIDIQYLKRYDLFNFNNIDFLMKKVNLFFLNNSCIDFTGYEKNKLIFLMSISDYLRFNISDNNIISIYNFYLDLEKIFYIHLGIHLGINDGEKKLKEMIPIIKNMKLSCELGYLIKIFRFFYVSHKNVDIGH